MRTQGYGSSDPVGAVKALCILILALSVAGLPVPARGNPGGIAAPQEDAAPPDASGDPLVRKLVHPDAIVGELERGSDKVKVIVNLVKPSAGLTRLEFGPEHRAEAIRRYNERLSRRHAEVEAIRAPMLAALEDRHVRVRHRYTNWASFAAEVTLEGLDRLAADPRVKSIEFDYPVKRLTGQGIPLMNGSAVRTNYNGQGVTIAVVDDGIDYRHPRLGGGGFPNSKVIGGVDLGDHDSNPAPDLNLEDCAHGTNCAGIAAGSLGTVGDYIGGVAYGAKLYAVKIFRRSDGGANDSDIIAAWDWCINHKFASAANPILVISVSLGLDGDWISSNTYTASHYKAGDVIRAGIVIVAAAGNNGWCNALEWPASLTDVVSVGAVYDAALGTISWEVDGTSCAPKTGSDRWGWYAEDQTAADKVAVYSNVAPTLDLFAPSNQAYTTDVIGADGVPGDYDAGFGGTSASCPYAAGAVACVQSAALAHTGAYLSALQVWDVLARTGDDVTDTKTPITKPRINLGRAIEEVASGRATNVVPVYRFWSGQLGHHFYTIKESERNKLVYEYANVWSYERVTYHTLAGNVDPAAGPVYRFWSNRFHSHFYTISERERDKLINEFSYAWTYEGPAFWAYPKDGPPAGTRPVYRFWSSSLGGHFYTMSEAEKNKLIVLYPTIWTYEDVAWYAYE